MLARVDMEALGAATEVNVLVISQIRSAETFSAGILGVFALSNGLRDFGGSEDVRGRGLWGPAGISARGLGARLPLIDFVQEHSSLFLLSGELKLQFPTNANWTNIFDIRLKLSDQSTSSKTIIQQHNERL